MAKKIYVDVKLTNYEVIGAEARGLIKPEEIHSVAVKGRIDTGCTYLAIPRDIADILALRQMEKVMVRYGDGGREERWRGSAVYVEINNRNTVVFPIIEAPHLEVCVSNPILEDMNLYVNAKTGEIYPNPQSPDVPLLEA